MEFLKRNKNWIIFGVVALAIVSSLFSEDKDEEPAVTEVTEELADDSQEEKSGCSDAIEASLLGLYTGKSEAYRLLGQDGQPMIINGNYIDVPGADWSFTLKDDCKVEVYSKSIEQQPTIFNHSSEYTIIENNDDFVKFEFDADYTHYNMTLDKKSETLTYTSANHSVDCYHE